MAVRNTKISRDILHNYKIFFSTTKSEPACSAKSQTNPQENLPEPNRLRYVLADANKSNFVLPQLDISKNFNYLSGTETKHLQPSMVPKFLEQSNTIEDQPNSRTRKIKRIPHAIRNYSTSTFCIPNRFFASKRSGKSKPAFEDCPPKKGCDKDGACPSHTLKECEPPKTKICHHEYVDPHCTKKFAPYPSFSESCAERLVDDPSECFQCPWKKCGGVERIKPQKRKYHTSSVLANMIRTTVDSPIPVSSQYLPGLFTTPSDPCAKKDPCKRPPDKCPKPEQKKKEHCEPKKKKKNPCHTAGINWSDAYSLWSSKQDIIPNVWLELEKPLTLYTAGKTRNVKRTPQRRFKKQKMIRKPLKKSPCCYPPAPNINRRHRLKVISITDELNHSMFETLQPHSESIDMHVTLESPSNVTKFMCASDDKCNKEEEPMCPPIRIKGQPLDSTVDSVDDMLKRLGRNVPKKYRRSDFLDNPKCNRKVKKPKDVPPPCYPSDCGPPCDKADPDYGDSNCKYDSINDVVLEFRDRDDCWHRRVKCPQIEIHPVPVDKTIDRRFTPKHKPDCCDAIVKEKTKKKKLIKPKVFVPDKR